MLSFKWTLLFLLSLASNVAAIPRTTAQNIEILVGASGAVGFASVLGWQLLKNSRAPEQQLNAVAKSQQDGILVAQSSLSPTPTATPTASEATRIVKTIVSKGSTDVLAQSKHPSMIPMTRFFLVEAWSNGTIIQIEEIVRLPVGDLGDRHPNSSVAAKKDTSLPHDNRQAGNVSLGIYISQDRPCLFNVSCSRWNLASIFVNAHADRKTKPIIEFARRNFFVVRDLLNKALALFLRFVPTHPAKAAFILVGIPLVTKLGPAAARKALVLLSRYAPLALLYLQDNLHRWIERHVGREEEPDLTIEACLEPLPVDEVVHCPISPADISIEPTLATQSSSSLAETPEDDGVEPLAVIIEPEQHMADDAEESRPYFADLAENLLRPESPEPTLTVLDRENYTDAGIFKSRHKDPFLRGRKRISNYSPPRRLRDDLATILDRPVAVSSAQEREEPLPERGPEAQIEASVLQLAHVPSGSPSQPRQAHLVIQAPEYPVAESEKVPSPPSSLSILTSSEDIPELEKLHEHEPVDSQRPATASNEDDLEVPELPPAEVHDGDLSVEIKYPLQSDSNTIPLTRHEQELPDVYDSEPTFPEGESIMTVSESVASPACELASLTLTEEDKKDEGNQPQDLGREPEEYPPQPTVEDDVDENKTTITSGQITGILEANTQEEEPMRLAAEESLQEPTGFLAGWTDEASRAAGDDIGIDIADFGGVFDTDTPISTPSKQPVVDKSKSTGERRPGRLRSQTPTRAAEPRTSRAGRSPGVNFATEADGSVVEHTCYFRTEEAPEALQDSMIVDARGQAATGVQVSNEQPIPMAHASVGEQQLSDFAAEDFSAGYQVQEQEQFPGTPAIDPAFLMALQSFSAMSLEDQAQSLAESTAALFPAAGDQVGLDLTEMTEAAAESQPVQLGSHDQDTDDFLSARIRELSLLQQEQMGMEYEHDGPAHQVPFAQEIFQSYPSPAQSTMAQEQVPVVLPGYEPARPAGMYSEQDGSAAPEQSGPWESQMHPTEMQQEFMAPEDVAALLEFNRGETSGTAQAASSEPAVQSTSQPLPYEEYPSQPLVPGLGMHQEADLEAERAAKVVPVKHERDNDLLPGGEYANVPIANRATRYSGYDRKILPMSSVYFRCEPSQRDTLLGASSQQAVNPFADLVYSAAPVNPGVPILQDSNVLQSGTESQDRADEMHQDLLEEIGMTSQRTPADEHILGQEEMASHYPPLDEDVTQGHEGGRSVDEEEVERPWWEWDEDSDNGYGGGPGDSDSEGNGDGEDGDNGYGGGHRRGDSGGSEEEEEPTDADERIDDEEEAEDDSSEDEYEYFLSRSMPGEEDSLPCRRRMFNELDRLQRRALEPSRIETPKRIFVNRRRTFVHASVAKNVWWCTTDEGRDWLWDNWLSIREDHGWDMIDLCQDTVDDYEEWAAGRAEDA
ncbi:hypothetical protein AYL99_09196 [Fonsecaea erecta]|uniref:CRAL-TRIO domain-containing protein n=1 Tax=Fonsecaea erecta TaxID=1367422 RepID=A0A178ZD33_9EURO|nr:hypothetical protein AYL99_09196 [Fonsecaea erecta]OAP57083.1 hypothetical protein AYL99_09196 [Fonsecaea erecta]